MLSTVAGCSELLFTELRIFYFGKGLLYTENIFSDLISFPTFFLHSVFRIVLIYVSLIEVLSF